MPHSRSRHALPLLLKKIRFTPVTAIQGARQTGKSYMAREILPGNLKMASYITLDQPSQSRFANDSPESFLAEYKEAFPLIIDETQKAPVLFDAIKYEVDLDRRPGRFLLLGSTEFSKLTRVRESLTGRMSRLRLFPLNLAETLELAPNPAKLPLPFNAKPRATRADVMKYLANGGMPAIFSVRSQVERDSLLEDWLDLTAHRDAQQFPQVKIEGALCYEILEKIAILPEPNAGAIAKAVRQELRKVTAHLNVLKTLFAINVLDPHPIGTGKPLYFLCDVGFANKFGADFERRLVTWTLNEILSQEAYRGEDHGRLRFYKSTKGSFIHFIYEAGKSISAIKILPREKIDRRELEILKAFGQKPGLKSAKLIALGATKYSDKKTGVDIFPWEAIV